MEKTLDQDRHYDNDDEHSNKREEKYGKCKTCKRYNTNYSWCQSCDPKLLTEGWTSGNETLDNLIKSTQLKATEYDIRYYLQWVPYDNLTDMEQIGEGGFATIYKANWINGDKFTANNERTSGNLIVALKKLHDSQDISNEFLNEFQNYVKFEGKEGIIHIFGLTRDPNTKEYIFVMEYKNEGSLHNYLSKKFESIKWEEKLLILKEIIEGLVKIHEQKIVHRDLHSGNILKSYFNSYIADLGLSIPADQASTSKGSNVFGVLPYVAPEVLNLGPYTMAADIYSFGVLMTLVSTGRQPFVNLPHDTDLAMKICQGLRPGFSKNTPKIYIELAYKCMDADPEKRPTAGEIFEIIFSWYDLFNDKPSQLYETELTKEIFEDMDKMEYDPSTTNKATIHPKAVYTSRLLEFTNLPEPVNSYSYNSNNSNNSNTDSQQIELILPDKILD